MLPPIVKRHFLIDELKDNTLYYYTANEYYKKY